MASQQSTASLLDTLSQYPEGNSYEALQFQSGLTEEQFFAQAKVLWDKGIVTGTVEEGCCGCGCAINCVAYMKKERTWKLASS